MRIFFPVRKKSPLAYQFIVFKMTPVNIKSQKLGDLKKLRVSNLN